MLTLELDQQVGGEDILLAFDIHVPAMLPADPLVLFCIPGGGMSRGYFALQDPQGNGEETRHFSFAQAMAEQGHIVILIDPVGVGGSSRPSDGFLLTSELLAEFNHHFVAKASALLRSGDLVPGLEPLPNFHAIGIGHSAGAMLVAMQQARYRDFAALVMLCFGTAGMPEFLDEEHRNALAAGTAGDRPIAEFARRRFGGAGYVDIPVTGKDSPASRALAAVQDHVLANIAVHAMTPGNIAPEIAALDVSVFIGVGERDITGPAQLMAGDYENCPHLTLQVVKGAGHHPFTTPDAALLHRRIANWLNAIAEDDL